EAQHMTAANDRAPTDVPAAAAGNDTAYPSLEAMRDAHSDLLERFQHESTSPALAADIERFRECGAATGIRLQSSGERQAAQSLIDFWATALYRLHREPPEVIKLARFQPGAEAS